MKKVDDCCHSLEGAENGMLLSLTTYLSSLRSGDHLPTEDCLFFFLLYTSPYKLIMQKSSHYLKKTQYHSDKSFDSLP